MKTGIVNPRPATQPTANPDRGSDPHRRQAAYGSTHASLDPAGKDCGNLVSDASGGHPPRSGGSLRRERTPTQKRSRPCRPRIATIPVLLLLALASASTRAAEPHRLRIGVTLHPYYSWVANIVGDKAEVVPVLPGSVNAHSYQPRPEDLVGLAGLDAIVVNGIGHDDFIEPMLEAAGRKDLPHIRPNEGLPLIEHNSHSFLAILGAIQQIHTIARELGKLDPPNAELYEQNATAYSKRLRRMLASALEKLQGLDASKVRIATVHEGYAYLFQELGLTIAAVVQPRHGIEPSAKQLADTIDRIRKADVNVLFTEMDLEAKYVDAIFQETGCKVLKLSHMSSGEYSAERFERDMQANLDTIVGALSQAR
jgi:zinc transport system substrate-binding protein